MSLNFIVVFICHLKKKVVFICRIKKNYVFICHLILNDIYIQAWFPDAALGTSCHGEPGPTDNTCPPVCEHSVPPQWPGLPLSLCSAAATTYGSASVETRQKTSLQCSVCGALILYWIGVIPLKTTLICNTAVLFLCRVWWWWLLLLLSKVV